MIVIQLILDESESVPCLTPEEMIRRLQEAFPDASASQADALAIEAKNAEEYYKKRGIENEKIPQIIIRSLLSKSERMGPVYRFSFIIDDHVKVWGNVRKRYITFFSKTPLSPNSERLITDFLRSFGQGRIEKSSG